MKGKSSCTSRALLFPVNILINISTFIGLKTYNKVILVGHLGADPSFVSFNSATEDPNTHKRGVWRLSVATNRNYKKGDEWVKETQWHRVSHYGNADYVSYTSGRFSKG
jgi:hypothetical protein